ncbi:MAG: hypothetical protein AB7K09_01750 [Planctomycetota bacterium]
MSSNSNHREPNAAIRAALRQLGFEVACTDSVLIGDHPVPIREIEAHGLPWVLAQWFKLDAEGTPPSPVAGYPVPEPPSALALPTEPMPPLRRRPPTTDEPRLEILRSDEAWGDSTLWGETSMAGGEDLDDDLLNPFEAGFLAESDIDSEESDHAMPVSPASPPDGAMIVWVPEQFSEKLLQLLGISRDGSGEPSPDAVMRLMRVLRHLQRKRNPGGADSRASDADGSAGSELTEQERRMLDAFGLDSGRERPASGDDESTFE